MLHKKTLIFQIAIHVRNFTRQMCVKIYYLNYSLVYSLAVTEADPDFWEGLRGGKNLSSCTMKGQNFW